MDYATDVASPEFLVKHALLSACFSFFAVAAWADVPRVDALGWMSGTWVQEAAGSTVTESWVGPGNGVMVAANLSTWASGRKIFEFLRIADTADGFSYFASPADRPAVEFKLQSLAQRRVTFENARNDFPQRIIYWREGEDLLARIEGRVGGKERSEEWRFTRR